MKPDTRLATLEPPGVADVLGDLFDTVHLDTHVHGRFELARPWGIRFPDDERAYLITVGRGEARLEVHGTRQPLRLAAGDVALLPHGGPHRLMDTATSPLTPLGEHPRRRMPAGRPIEFGGDDSDTTLVICSIRIPAAHRMLSIHYLRPAIHISASHPAATPALAATARRLVTEGATADPGAAVIMQRLADILLVDTLRIYLARHNCPLHTLRALTDPRIAAALAAIHRDPGRPWTVERLAATAAMSRSGFATRFTTLVGTPPADYLIRWRLTRAAELLRDGSLTISQIAASCGYHSEASFNRAFKRLHNVTPGAYRRRRTQPRPHQPELT